MLGPRFISHRVAPRGPFSIARPADRRAECLHMAITGRDRRDATGKARKTPITRRRLAIGSSGDGVSRRPPRAAAAAEDSSSSTPTPSSSSSPSSSSALVDALLASVAGASADRGSSMSSTERAAADALFDRLARAAEAERRSGGAAEAASSPSSSSSSSSSSPLDSPFLLGDFDVAYVSTGGRQKGQPAGGRFRSGLGRALFATTAVCQSIFYDDDDDEAAGDGGEEEKAGGGGGGKGAAAAAAAAERENRGGNVEEEKDKTLMVTNKVAFRLAGLLEGSVGLRGKVTAAFPSSDWSRAEKKTTNEGGEKEDEKVKENDEIADAVRVDFDPAVLSLLPRSRLFRLVLRIGRPSWVALATPYVDERVRLGLGSLGSRFLFVRGGEAERQGMRRAGLMRGEEEATGPGAKFALLSLSAGLLCASAALLGVAWRSGAACLASLAAVAAPSPPRNLAAAAAAALSLLLPAAVRTAAALAATLFCGRFSLGALRAIGGGNAAAGERERVGPGGRGDSGGVSAPSS